MGKGTKELALAVLALFVSSFAEVRAQDPPALAPWPEPLTLKTRTKVVLLGTGTPTADPDRSGPAVAIVVDEMSYLVDFGPGVVRRAAAAARDKGIYSLEVPALAIAFTTHLHSDHTAGLADLMLTPWSAGRPVPLQLFGPPGIKAMTNHILMAYEQDIAVRTDGRDAGESFDSIVNAYEVEPGVVYRDPYVTVEAIAVNHGTWKHAFGYRFKTADRTIVISGDTAPSENLIEAARGCDVLVHEVYSRKGFDLTSDPGFQSYHSAFHTSGIELGKIAAEVKPGLLVLYHQLPWGESPDQILGEIRENYDGDVVYGNDLDVF